MDFEQPIQPVATLGRNNSLKPSRDTPMFSWIPASKWGKAALSWSLLQLILSVSIEIYILSTHINYLETVQSNVTQNQAAVDNVILTNLGQNKTWNTIYNNGQAITVYHGIFIAAQVFQLILITDALAQLSLIQLMTSTAFNFASWGYAIVQYGQASNWLPSMISSILKLSDVHPTTGAEIALIVIFFGFCAGWVFLSYKLYFEFGWTSYKALGADLGLRNVLHLYHIYLMLLKIDVFFFLGFDIQFLFLILRVKGTTVDLLLHSLISFPGTIIALVLAYYAVRKENKILVYTTLLLCIGLIGYLSSKLYDIWGSSNNARFESSKNSLTFFISLTILVIVLTMSAAITNMNHFGEGLIEKLSSKGNETQRQDTYAME